MIPLLIELGLALAGGVAQKMAADEQTKRARMQHQQDVVRGIYDKRAARAGDSMYTQQALQGTRSMPKQQSANVGPMLAGVGQALLSHTEAPGADAVTKDVFSSAVPGGSWESPEVAGDRGGYDVLKQTEQGKRPWDDEPWGDGGF